MTRYFNTEGRCRPDKHYMVRLDERLKAIKEQLVDREKYFVINRGRQYGKTTTLMALAEYLKDEYIVVFMDFQMIGSGEFATEESFVRAFAEEFHYVITEENPMEREELVKPLVEFTKNIVDRSIRKLFAVLSGICKMADKPIVMMIDEVDNASNNQVFIDFLAQLRGYYLARERRPIFHSVILAGVYDIKNLKLKIRPDSEHQYNSPWNIAADFDINMGFSAGQIAGMLEEYETERHTGMDVSAVAKEIYQYTSGYPYLVSAICKMMDEKLPGMETFFDNKNIWTKEGIEEAVKLILKAKTTLFDSMMKHISEYPDLKQMLYAMLFQGEQMAYNQDNHTIELACMFGYVINEGIYIRVANRIFETRLYNLFLSEEELSSVISKEAKLDKNQFVIDGRLDMERVLAKFVEHFHDIYGDNQDKFIENDGRKFFLLYLRPIINGTGNYYIEAQTRDERRTDIIVDYAGEQFIIEMKIWRGNEYNERGEQQLTAYLDYFHQKKGYLLSFNFNKKKETGVKTITIGEKTIVEAVV
ncbi:MAG: AAA-like domain-containing protein [Lachnospiraceae bacterium]|nr:AAA-like domain-containing protein [Lachnospiraceae bacterium]